MRVTMATALWIASCIPEWRRFRHSLSRVEATQTALLRSYLTTNGRTEFGRRHGFDRLRSVADYQRAVPLSTFDDYAQEIAALAGGRPAVLTAAPVRCFELSSGSTAASKLIPYTAALKAEFQRGLAPWIVDTYTRDPALWHGPAYWSITPLTDGPTFTPAGIPIGFEEDSAYLGPLGRTLVETVLAVPNTVKHLADVTAFRYVTLCFLLARGDLRLISIWNPTYLDLLLAPLPDWWDRLLADIAAGTLTPPVPLPPELHLALAGRLRPAPRRAAALNRLAPTDLSAIWPALHLISGWADGPAAEYAHRLAARFPGVPFQGKGLLATEAFVSLPFDNAGNVLAVRSHFFEFQPADQPESPPRLAHQLERGQTYTVIVTTGGGFYRYQLHDIVEAVGYREQAPLLRFVGKTDRVSDWFGEKLEEHFVAEVLARLNAAHGLAPVFALLAPDDAPEGFHYTLYLELPPETPPELLRMLQAGLETALRRNFHYDYCRKLGQLSAARVCRAIPGAAEAYLRACRARGQKLGNIKPAVLQKSTGWGEWLADRMEGRL